MGVFLHCHLCGRKQADGLLSRNYWGHLELGPGHTLRACPTCKERHFGDWEHRLRATLNGLAPGIAQTGAEAPDAHSGPATR